MIFKTARPEPPYTQIHNNVINEPGLSAKAKWILIYLLSKPHAWKVYEKDIQRHCTDGRDSIRSGVKELIHAGYILRSKERVRDKEGHLKHYEYSVFDKPQFEDLQINQTDDPYDGFPYIGKPTHSNINSSKPGKPHQKKTQSMDEYLDLCDEHEWNTRKLIEQEYKQRLDS